MIPETVGGMSCQSTNVTIGAKDIPIQILVGHRHLGHEGLMKFGLTLIGKVGTDWTGDTVTTTRVGTNTLTAWISNMEGRMRVVTTVCAIGHGTTVARGTLDLEVHGKTLLFPLKLHETDGTAIRETLSASVTQDARTRVDKVLATELGDGGDHR